jgi:serine/threonine protein phosphatase PrpC
MACVLTLALVEDGRITIGHVGDSRLYLLWDGAIRKLTSDHSPVGEDEDAGALTEEEAMLHPRRNEVFRDVGSRLRDVDDGDFVEIRQCRFREDAELVEAANLAGGKDNIPALFVAGPKFRGSDGATRPRPATTTRQHPRASRFGGRLAFLTYGVLIGMLLWAVLRK